MENVAEKDAQAANLGNKKNLTVLRLQWTDLTLEPQHDHQKVLEALKPHEGIKALGIYRYGGNTCPTWINTLQHMVTLDLSDCKFLKRLPPLWRLPDLQVLCIIEMTNLLCLCGGDPPFRFNKLKQLKLYRLPNFGAWCDIDKVQGQDVIFPEVEKLSIFGCEKLTALPRASLITELSDGVNMGCRSAFPTLKELELRDLATFQRWETAEGIAGEQITTFPSLEKLKISDCPELTTLPEAPKLNELDISDGTQEIGLHAARYITLLSTLHLSLAEPTDRSLIKLVDDTKKYWSPESSLREIFLNGCNFLFPANSSALGPWNCLVKLEELQIWNCNVLVHWPEDVFWRLISLRRLTIWRCNNLTGCTQASEQSTPGQSVPPPRLESLGLWHCDSLLEVPVLPASLTALNIRYCGKLDSVIVRKQQQTTGLGSRDSRQEKSALIGGSRTEAIPNDSLGISATYRVAEVPIAHMRFEGCNNLRSLSVQVDCTELMISSCSRLESLADLPPVECLIIWCCESLASIPDVPEAYNSLRDLQILQCPSLKALPPCLKQRLNDIERIDLDACYTDSAGPKQSRPSTWKYAITRHC